MNRVSIAISFLVCSLLFSSASAQELQWAKAMTGGEYETRSRAIVTDDTGNIYICGEFADTVDFDPTLGVVNLVSDGFGMSMFIQKLSPSGDLLWVKQFYGTALAYDIALDANNNIYITGPFFDTVDFDPGINEHKLTAVGVSDAFVLKLSSAGDFTWVKTVEGISAFESFIEVDNTGGIYVSGVFNGSVDFDPGPGVYQLSSSGSRDVYVLKLDNTGNFFWADVQGMPAQHDDEVGAMCLDDNNNLILGGRFAADGTVLKYDPVGNLLWLKKFPGSTSVVLSIAADLYGNIICGGLFSQTVDFDPGVSTHNLIDVGNGDGFVLKLGINGDLIWVKQIAGIGNEAVWNVAVDNAASVYASGIIDNITDFNYGSTPETLSSWGLFDIFTSKFDQYGNLMYVGQEGGVDDDDVYASCLSTNGELILTGKFQNSADLNPASSTFTINAPGNYNIFVQKLVSTVTTQVIPEETAIIYPNPTSGNFTIQSSTGMRSVQVRDALGKEVYVAQPGYKAAVIDLDVPTGLYYISVYTDIHVTTQKILVTRD